MNWNEWREKYWTKEIEEDVVYEFKAPKGFEDRWRISDMILPPGVTYMNASDGHEEIIQCPSCELYHNNPKHQCKSS